MQFETNGAFMLQLMHSDFKTSSNEFNQTWSLILTCKTKDGQYANHNAISIRAVKNYQINDNVFIVTNDCTNRYIKSIERIHLWWYSTICE